MTINRQIINRFFEALDTLINAGVFTGIGDFCEKYRFNRIRYTNLKNHPDHKYYKTLEIEAIYILVTEFNFSADWLITGRGRARI